MKHQEAACQRERLAKYDRLANAANDVAVALKQLDVITGNASQVQEVSTIEIVTRQGRTVRLKLDWLVVKDWEVKDKLVGILREKSDQIDLAMEQI